MHVKGREVEAKGSDALANEMAIASVAHNARCTSLTTSIDFLSDYPLLIRLPTLTSEPLHVMVPDEGFEPPTY